MSLLFFILTIIFQHAVIRDLNLEEKCYVIYRDVSVALTNQILFFVNNYKVLCLLFSCFCLCERLVKTSTVIILTVFGLVRLQI